MALTGMQIYKSLPKTNCKECGFPTCMAFAMQVAAKQKALTDCPQLSDDAKARLARIEEELESLKSTINEAIAKGVAPTPRKKVRVELMEVYKYLPRTNCGKCGEQGCYSFAIRLMAGQVTLDMCTLLKEPEYTDNQEHLQTLTAYI